MTTVKLHSAYPNDLNIPFSVTKLTGSDPNVCYQHVQVH